MNSSLQSQILNLSEPIAKYIRSISTKHKFLTNYQFLILQYFLSEHFANKNLLILWLSVGRGKTLLSLSCAICGLQRNMFKRVVILCPKAVVDEFYKNMRLYWSLLYPSSKNKQQTEFDKYISFFHIIPYNSWKAYSNISKLKDLEKTLFIIDEAHLFMKSIIKVNLRIKDFTDRSMKYVGNCKRIYDLIDSLRKKKVLALTGTPSAKTPFEMIPMFNLAYNTPLFEESYEKFNDKYIDFDDGKVVHTKELVNKLDGLIAYVPAAGKNNKSVPRATALKEIEVEMSENQYKQYLIDYEKELDENSNLGMKTNIYGLIFGTVSTFHTKTFEDCIYWNDRLKNRKNEDRYIGKIIADEEHCPKIMKMYRDSKRVDGSAVFYFRFARMYGVECMGTLLENEGYEKVEDDDIFEEGKRKRYAIFSGSESSKWRDRCKEMFNDKRNRRGEYIRYLLLSPSGSVGITLKNVRFLGIGSVEFNYSAIRQILGRVNRINSHEDLPLEDRTVENRIYVMKKNEAYYRKHKKWIEELCSRKAPGSSEIAPSIEKIILYDSYEDDKINEDFKNNVLREASITKECWDKF